tara:strand:- start:390 stop:557 length:168 start_codon:yes stop_codon:yes gene_type:complete
VWLPAPCEWECPPLPLSEEESDADLVDDESELDSELDGLFADEPLDLVPGADPEP